MQRYWRCSQRREVTSFSTLYGSKWVATLDRRARITLQRGFSTLYGSKWVATTLWKMNRVQHFWFQYPLRVEVGCNAAQHTGLARHDFRFSTLYGSKWVATLDVRDSRARKCGFQYPLRVEVGCNLLSHAPVGTAALSFSTLYGSKWVATGQPMHASSSAACVSVPSTGRSGLQRGDALLCV